MSNYEYSYKIGSNFTFEKFKVSDGNRELYEFMRDFAENIENYEKPVFIGGGSIFRTQLMLCLYNYLKETKPEMKTVYMSGEDFVNSLIKSIKERDIGGFEEYLDSIDCLIIDNVEHLCGKESCIESFWNLYRKCCVRSVPVVLGSDYSKEKVLEMDNNFEKVFELCEDFKLSE